VFKGRLLSFSNFGYMGSFSIIKFLGIWYNYNNQSKPGKVKAWNPELERKYIFNLYSKELI
jgi:hypothetical protein